MNQPGGTNDIIPEPIPVLFSVRSITLFSRSTDDAMCVLRILGPAAVSNINVIKGVEEGTPHFERVNEGDLVVIQRDFCRELEAYEKVITLAHTAKKPVVMDLDDLLFELPADHPDRKSYYYTDSLLPMLQAIMEVDLVSVATHTLRDYLMRFNENVRVFPNYLNDTWWRLNEPVVHDAADGSVWIGYMGGHTHKQDLLHILPVLESICKKYQPRIKFHFWGIEAPEELEPFSQVDWCPPKTYSYYDFATYFQTQSADIMIAPLVDTLFTRSKSCIKYLEYGSLGISGVYSRVAPYEEVVEDGVDGFLAGTLEQWESALSKLIDEPQMRLKMALNAQEKIRQHWLLSKNAVNLLNLYNEALQEFPRPKPSFHPFYGTLKSLTRQLFEGSRRFSELNNQIKTLDQQIAQISDQNTELKRHLDDCEDEITSIMLSKSWRITRPLRIITGKLRGTR